MLSKTWHKAALSNVSVTSIEAWMAGALPSSTLLNLRDIELEKVVEP